MEKGLVVGSMRKGCFGRRGAGVRGGVSFCNQQRQERAAIMIYMNCDGLPLTFDMAVRQMDRNSRGGKVRCFVGLKGLTFLHRDQLQNKFGSFAATLSR